MALEQGTLTAPLELRSAGRPRIYYAAAILTLVYCFAFVDRQIFNLLVAPLKRDFSLDDMHVGYLLGPAFILSYVALGLPAGWCADRFNRRNLIVGAGLVWGMGTMAAAFAHDYQTMFYSRLLVGASEAFLYPAGMSLIADLYDRKQLPLATSIFLLAPPLGGGFALLAGGHILQVTQQYPHVAIPFLGSIHGWQATLLAIGFIGLIPVLLMLTLRDPKRRVALTATSDQERSYGFVEGSVHMLRRWRFYIAFFFGMASSSLVMVTVSAWAPTYLSRAFGLSPGEIGTRYGTLVLVFGLAGGIASPLINRWLSRWRTDSTMETVRLGPYMLTAFAILLYFARTEFLALVCLALLTFSYSFPMSMASASLQIAAPSRLRGIASAYYFVIVSLLGYGIGPTAVPFVTEHVLHDPNQIGIAISAISAGFGLVAIILLHIALKGFRIENADAKVRMAAL